MSEPCSKSLLVTLASVATMSPLTLTALSARNSRACSRSRVSRCSREKNRANLWASSSLRLIRNWYSSYGEVRSAEIQTAPFSVLPNLVPSARSSSGQVIAYAVRRRVRRM